MWNLPKQTIVIDLPNLVELFVVKKLVCLENVAKEQSIVLIKKKIDMKDIYVVREKL